jgi:hypothetical protein
MGAAAVLACFAPVDPANAITTSHRLTVSPDVGAFTVGTDRSVQVTARRPEPTSISHVLSTLRPNGTLGPSTFLLSSPRQPPRYVATAITRHGAIAAYQRPAGPGRLRSIEVVSVARGGRPSAPQRISPASGSASEPISMAAGGAAAVLFTQRRPHRSQRLMWAYRPAGATRFLPARTLTAPRTYNHFRYVVQLGPRGDGAVLETSIFPEGKPPPFRVRRLGIHGSVGPWISVSDEGYEDGVGALALAPDGTIAIAIAADRAIEGQAGSALLSTSLAPGASAPTPMQHLGVPASGGLSDFSLKLAIGRSGQAAIATTADRSNRIELFTGPAGALKLTGEFDAPGIDIERAITVTRDGGVTAVWAPNAAFKASPMVGTHQPPGGRFSPPRTVARTRYKGDYSELNPSFLVPLGGSDALLGYLDEDGDRTTTHLVTLSP